MTWAPPVPSSTFAAAEATRPWLDPDHDPYFRAWQAGASAAAPYGARAGARVRVDGRSLYWRGIVLRIEGYALADWPPAIGRLLLDDGPDGYAAAERRLTNWRGRPLGAPRAALYRSAPR